jgi:outer membrane receptor protein involved in Fe transport
MKQTLLKTHLGTFVALLISVTAWAQTTISGKINEASGDPLVGVNIVVKGTIKGTITNINGNFNLSVSQSPPFTLSISYVGFITQEIEITETSTSGLGITMAEQTLLGQEIVVSASRVEESILSSPVTIEKLDILAIQQASAPDFFDQLNYVKGVQTAQGSMTFNAVNTRGFATIANTRFVALVDGMDISAPLLNFPTGNLVGIPDLDVESVELVPGAASALYGPNAFNGILFMNSKNPFEYQGLSAQAKLGVTESNANGTNPMYNFQLRYAKAFNNKVAFKVNFSIMEATDWRANDYTTDKNFPIRAPGDSNFDGLNLYGDEVEIFYGGLGPFLGALDLRRTGWKEEDLLETDAARSIKADAALHYRLTDKIEALYNYRFGGGRSIYQGSGKFILRDFTQQFHKLELKSDNFFVRGYMTQTDDGDSYNMDALGIYLNESISPTATEWAPIYIPAYVLALQGYYTALGVPAGNKQAAHAFARQTADATRPAVGSSQFTNLVETIRTTKFNEGAGAAFVEGSRLYHGEFNYDFKNMIDIVDIQIGGNFRQYDIFSDGTIFDEEQNADGSYERVKINEYGGYVQLGKSIGNLKLAASARYDKNENFEGQFNPRVSAVYTAGGSHNFRASFQTGFRNPDSQSQFIWFPTASGILIGSTEANAARYGLHNGGAYTNRSVLSFFDAGGSFDTDGTPLDADGNPTDPVSAGLATDNFDYVQPEKLQAFEVGYKGIIGGDLLIDLNYYHNIYNDFIAQKTVYNKLPIMRRGQVVRGATGDIITEFRPYLNAQEKVTSDGIGLGFTYNLGRGFNFNGSYDYATFNVSKVDLNSEFEAGFNTPEHKFMVGFANRDVGENIGFSVAFRWQDEFLWQSAFGEGTIPSYGTLDFQINKKLKALKSVIKVGATNLGGQDYRTNLGAGFVGTIYYISLTFDQFLN